MFYAKKKRNRAVLARTNMFSRLLLASVFMLVASASFYNKPLKIKYQWFQIDYEFNSEQERNAAIANGSFDIGHLQPIDAQYYYSKNQSKEKIFISIPRFSAGGIPATFGMVSETIRDGNNLLKPYPSWSWHVNLEKCNFYRIVSVFRSWVDECNRLWVLDAGVVADVQWCPPQILIFNLETDELLEKYEVPFQVHKNQTLYVTPVVELETDGGKPICQKAWLYGADIYESLLVFSLEQKKSWAYRHPSFNYNENYTTMVIEGLSFSFDDGIFGLALSPIFKEANSRRLYYHALNGNTENWVYTKYLRNRVNDSQIFNTIPTDRGEQSAPEAFDKWGNLYFPLIKSLQVVSWNIQYPYTRKYWRIIGNNLQFPSGLKVSPGKQDQEQLWVFATSLQRYATGNLNNSQINFRLFYKDL